MIKLKEFVDDHANIFALILGILIFYKFADATNPAVQSFLWLFSSFIVVCLLTYIFFKALWFDTSAGVKFCIGIPLFLLDMVFTLQLGLSLFEPNNIYSLNVVSALFTFQFLINILLTMVAIFILVAIFYLAARLSKR